MAKLGEIENPVVRFWRYVDRRGDDDCWLWLGARVETGYGTFMTGRHEDGRMKMSNPHRFSYEIHKGPIPPKMHIDHLCRTPLCVNPYHLEIVTPKENTLRGIGPAAVNAQKTACKRGHPFTDRNTYRDKLGKRACRECQRLTQAARKKGIKFRGPVQKKVTQTSLSLVRKSGPKTKDFMDNVMPEPNSGCWIWMGEITENGFGTLSVKHTPREKATRYLAHRFSYEKKYGHLPPDRQISHKCGVRSCVNPDHLKFGRS